jgi:hypothetical protein
VSVDDRRRHRHLRQLSDELGSELGDAGIELAGGEGRSAASRERSRTTARTDVPAAVLIVHAEPFVPD